MGPSERSVARLPRCDLRSKAFLAGGLALVLVACRQGFLPDYSVPWDARDEMWIFFRWYGSALRAGHFGDYFPAIGAGYPVNSNLVSGGYNPLYLAASVLFPSSVFSINMVAVLNSALAFALSFAIGRTLRLRDPAAWLLGLSVCASGYFIGHSSHFSYLSTGLAGLGLFLSLRLASAGRTRAAFFVALLSTAHVGTTGSPEGMVFTASVLVVAGALELVRSSARRRLLLGCGAGVVAGLLLASPALFHFLHQLPNTSRVGGLPVAVALSGSLPPWSLLNLANPAWRLHGIPDAVDPTMDRFHLLFFTPFLLLGGVFLDGRRRRLYWVCMSLATIFLLLALGRHAPIPVREWLAESVYVFRVGRFPSGQHRGFALFCLALGSALALDGLWPRLRSRHARIAVVTLLAVDFLVVMDANAWLRFQQLDPWAYRGRLPRFQVEFGAGESHHVNRPRLCPSSRQLGLASQIRAPPRGFTWSGYTKMASTRYRVERRSMRWALCGPSRLWRARSREPQPYELIYYGPDRVHLRTLVPARADDRLLLWADVDDGLWEMAVDGEEAPGVRLPADLRGIDLSGASGGSTVEIEMVYRGPFSRLWRHLETLRTEEAS